VGVLEIFVVCPLDIWWVSCRFLIGVVVFLIGVLEIFGGCLGDILWVS